MNQLSNELSYFSVPCCWQICKAQA